MLVRYWAAAREVAGAREQQVAAGPLDDVLRALGALHGARMTALLARSVLLVDGAQVDGRPVLSDSQVLEVLPPYAGGAA